MSEAAPPSADISCYQDWEPVSDCVLPMTVIPWLSFTGFSLTRRPQVDAVPLLAWGKVLEDADCTLLLFSVSSPHALVDGLHIGQVDGYISEEARELTGSFG